MNVCSFDIMENFLLIKGSNLVLPKIQIFQTLHIEVPDPFITKGITCHCCHANPRFHGCPRYDWVVLDNKPAPGEECNGIDHFVIGLLQFLMVIELDGEVHNVALLQWYDILGSKDPETGLSITKCTERYNFHTVNKIVCLIHLIPFFKTLETARAKLGKGNQEYNFNKYLVNHYSDRFAFENFCN